VHAASQIEAVAALLAGLQVPVLQLVLAAERPGTGPQVLVLTGPVAQGKVDLLVHALQAHAVAAGAATALRVEALDA
jgi:homoserine dehydrogenase